MSIRLATFALASLLAASAARAEPAVISVFEAVARAEPSLEAAPVQTLVEGAAVSVSEESQAGWRRVRLADGRIAWVEEKALAFPAKGGAAVAAAAAPAAAAGAAPRPAPAPDLRAKIYVKDLDHLAELVKEDAKAGPMAAQLASRRKGAFAVGGISLAAGIGCMVYGMSQATKHTDVNDPQFGQTGSAGGAFVAGGVIMAGGMLLAYAIAPKRADLLEVINTWNTGHPSEQFTYSEGHVDQ
jgi:hypothetical protein